MQSQQEASCSSGCMANEELFMLLINAAVIVNSSFFIASLCLKKILIVCSTVLSFLNFYILYTLLLYLAYKACFVTLLQFYFFLLSLSLLLHVCFLHRCLPY